MRSLVVQGERDPFGTPGDTRRDVDLVVVPDGDHGLKVRKSAPVSQAEALDLVLERTFEWIVREVAGNRND